MVTSTACKPNQPHESTSSTSKIETTTTTTPTIEDPNKEIKIKRNELINMIENEFNNRGDNYKNSEKIIYVTKHWGDDYSCTVGALFQDEKKLTGVLSGRITEEDYMYLINNIAPKARLLLMSIQKFLYRSILRSARQSSAGSSQKTTQTVGLSAFLPFRFCSS